MILSKDSSDRHYQKIQIKKSKKSRKRYQNPTEEEKIKNREYGHERYTNLPEAEKQELVEYRKRYHKMRKNKDLS